MSGAGKPAIEKEATQIAPLPLPRHEGDAHYQSALDSDKGYGRLVLGACVLAAFAGSGFGLLATDAGVLTTVLWSMTVAGLAARCVASRAAWKPGAVAPAVMTSVLRLMGVLTIVCAVLSSVSSGRAGLWTAGVALAISLVLGLAALMPASMGRMAPVILLALGGGLGFAVVQPASLIGAIVAGFAGVIVAAAVAITARAARGQVNFPFALSRLTFVAWAVSSWRPGSELSGTGVLCLVAIAAVLVLDFHTVQRTNFAVTVAAIAFLHLAGLLALHNPLLGARLWLQLPAVAAEYVCVVFAGFRHVEAERYRLSSATYRIAPLCIVPRLDRAWDYPVKISAN